MPTPMKLTVYRGAELLGEHRFERDIVKIGRLASAHLKLEDQKVSRIHAVIEAASDGSDYSIIDMGSTEGTFVNNQKVSKERLRSGDEIRLGDCRLLVQFETSVGRVDSPPAPLTPPPADPRELWSAVPADFETAQPTMQLAPAVPMMEAPGRAVSMAGQATPSALRSTSAPGVPISQPQGWAMPAGSNPNVQMPAPMPAWGPPGLQDSATMPQIPLGVQSGYPQVYSYGYATGEYPQPSLVPQGTPSYLPQMPMSGVPIQLSPWGAVPNNIASEGVPESERELEVKTLWGGHWTSAGGQAAVLDTLAVSSKPAITMGDERKTKGWGPFQEFVRCDIEVPSKGLPAPSFAVATSQSPQGASYVVNIPSSFGGRLERIDGTIVPLEDLLRRAERGDAPGVSRYTLQAAETLYLVYGDITLQLRYVRKARLIPPAFWADLNYTWVNMLILAFFVHVMAVVSFIATPQTQAELTESIFKNPNRFAQFRLTPEEKKKKQDNDALKKLKEGEAGAKAKGVEGKAGRKDYDPKKKQGRMAVKGDPNDKEIAKSMLTKLFGAHGNTGRSYLFGSGGLGGELKGALGGVTGAEIGDATGLGGLGTRGSGPGGGGLSMNSVGLGALGTAGRGGGQSGYGEGVGGLGKKAERDINISTGQVSIQGSLDKEIIRRVIREHMEQIRYCYEKELTRTPGLFGKIATQFTIGAQGNVTTAGIENSSMNNDEVERCITSRIRTWVFPKPKGGGVVIVKYPFIFKTAG